MPLPSEGFCLFLPPVTKCKASQLQLTSLQVSGKLLICDWLMDMLLSQLAICTYIHGGQDRNITSEWLENHHKTFTDNQVKDLVSS